jgi:hypothetical protein
MNRMFLLYVKIESESSVFGIGGSSGEERGVFCCYLSLLWSVVELSPKLTWFRIVLGGFKRNKPGFQLFTLSRNCCCVTSGQLVRGL